MNYRKIYNQLVQKRQINVLPYEKHYTVKHHIIPRSIRPDLEFEQSNIINLTYREHYFLHRLLPLIYLDEFGENSKEYRCMCYALNEMSLFKKYKKYASSKVLANAREKFAIQHSKAMSGKNNPRYGKSWKDGKTKEQLEEIAQKKKNTWKNKSDDLKKEFSLKRSNYMKSLTKEQYQIQTQKRLDTIKNKGINLSLMAKDRYEKLSEEEKQKIIKRLDFNSYSEEKKLEIRRKISKANSGKNNPMYGKNSYDHLTLEQQKKRIEKLKKNLIGKNKGKIRLFNIETNKEIRVKLEFVQEYLSNGYTQKNPNVFRKMKNNNGDVLMVKECDFQKYLNEGYNFTNKKNCEKYFNNQSL